MNHFKFFVIAALMLLIYQADARKKQEVWQKTDYSRDALISVTPNSVVDRDYLLFLLKKKIVDLWNEDLRVIGGTKLMRVDRGRLKGLMKSFKKRNMKVDIVSPNLQRLIYPSSNPHIMEGDRHPKNFSFKRYHSFEKIELFLKHLTEKHNDISKLETFGESFEKRPLYAVKVSLRDKSKNSRNEENVERRVVKEITRWKFITRYKREEFIGSSEKKIILIDCGIHGREWASICFCLYFIHELITGYKENKKKYKTILMKYDFIIIPIMNPDGYIYTHEHDRLWRKTRSKTPGSQCVGADGNRNFYSPGKCEVNDPCAETYCGQKPFSEPEIAAFKALLEETSGRLKAYFDIHSFGQYWLIPWAKLDDKKPRHYDEMIAVAEVGVKALRKRYNTKYSLGMASELLYPSSGVSLDYVYEKGYANYSFVLELRDKGECGNSMSCGFLLPEEKILPTCIETTDGVIATILAMK